MKKKVIHDKLKKGVSVDYNTMMTTLFGVSLASKDENLRKDFELEMRATNRKLSSRKEVISLMMLLVK